MPSMKRWAAGYGFAGDEGCRAVHDSGIRKPGFADDDALRTMGDRSGMKVGSASDNPVEFLRLSINMRPPRAP